MSQKIRYQLHRMLKTALSGAAVLACAGIALVFAVSHEAPAHAQSSSLTLSNIQVAAVTNNSATITWTSSAPADSKVNYGLTGNYGLSESNSTPVTTHAIVIGGLQAGTVYHFQVVSTDASNNTAQSLDRTLTTSSGTTSDTTPPNIFNVRVDAVDTSAIVTFTTNEEAGITLNYGTTTAYGSTVNLATTFVTAHNISLSPLTGSTTYHYQINATDRAGNVRLAGDFTFATSGSPFDHTFTTGNCSDGTDIGQCNAGGQYCDNGTLIYNCTQCGFTCSNGQTCRQGGVCVQDPPQSGSAYECNPAICYTNNIFTTPAPAGCYASWDRCNANIILKVTRDRVCDKWLSCETGTSVVNKNTGKQELLCYNLGGCNQLGPDGTCIGVLTKHQCTNDPLTLCNSDSDCPSGGSCVVANRHCSNAPSKTCGDDSDCGGGQCVGGIANVTYTTPTNVNRIKNLSGAVVAGLDWTTIGGSPVIQGMYPWNVMMQLGGKITISNSSFEERTNDLRCDNDLGRECADNNGCSSPGKCVQALVYNREPWVPWSPTNEFNETNVNIQNIWEDNDPNSGNRVLQITPTTEEFSGAAARVTGNPDESFYVTLDIKSDRSGTKAAVQFIERTPSLDNAVVELTTNWQRVTIGPARGVNQTSTLRVMCYNDGAPCEDGKIFIDNIQVRPILEIRSTDTDSSGSIVSRVAPRCRLYPRGDSQACEYVDQNGINYRGWYGYCLEEWPAGSGNCISWWPVDLIKGEFNAFGDETTAGYQGRVPLYYCLESNGKAAYNQQVLTETETLFSDSRYGSNTTAATNRYSYEIGNINIAADPTVSESGWDGMNVTLSAANTQGLNGVQNDQDEAADRTNFWQGCWYRSQGNETSASFKCTADQVKTVQNIINTNTSSPPPVHYDNQPDIAILRVTFSDVATTKDKVVSWRWWLVDDSSGSGTVTFNGNIRSQEMCTKIVQVATTDKNRAWAQRVNEGSIYTVDGLNYNLRSDLAPFGGLVAPGTADPSTWITPLFAQQPAADLDFPYQSRSGSPYACVGNCNQRRCLGGKGINTYCSRSEDCTTSTGVTGVCMGVGTCSNAAKACTNDSQCGTNALCLGGAASSRGTQTIRQGIAGVSPRGTCSNNAAVDCDVDSQCGAGICVTNTYAQQRIMRLFAQSYGMWQWDYTLHRYAYVSGSGANDPAGNNLTPRWLPPEKLCSDAAGNLIDRPPFDPPTNESALGDPFADYCAIAPTVTNLVIGKNNAKSITLAPTGGTVEFRFTVTVDPQQAPIQAVTFDWDGDPATTADQDRIIMNNAAPKSSLSDPHIISHDYACGGNCAPVHPKLIIEDNWGWCSSATVNEKCPNDLSRWYPLQGADTVTINFAGF